MTDSHLRTSASCGLTALLQSEAQIPEPVIIKRGHYGCSFCRYVPMAEAQPPAWQEIESAPKDGTLVLLWMATGYQDIGKWFQGSPAHIGWWNVRAIGVTPTHWMPLPKGPTE